jgi:hypothetical protein
MGFNGIIVINSGINEEKMIQWNSMELMGFLQRDHSGY